jgi:hypothetical protein
MVGYHFCDYVIRDCAICLAQGLSLASFDEAVLFGAGKSHEKELRAASDQNQLKMTCGFQPTTSKNQGSQSNTPQEMICCQQL